MNATFPVTIAYDMKLKRPGCALLQASYGASIGNFELSKFDVKNWILAPTDDMKLYTLKTEEELERAIIITKDENKER